MKASEPTSDAVEASMAHVQQVIEGAMRELFVPLGKPADAPSITVRYEGVVRRLVITQKLA